MVHPIHSSSLLLLLHSVSTYNAHIAFLLHHIFPANCRNSSYKVNCNRQQKGMNCWCNLFSPFFISTQMSIKHWVLSLKATDSPQISAIYSKYIRLGEWKCAFVHSLTCFLHYSDNKIMSEYFHLRPQREREREKKTVVVTRFRTFHREWYTIAISRFHYGNLFPLCDYFAHFISEAIHVILRCPFSPMFYSINWSLKSWKFP